MKKIATISISVLLLSVTSSLSAEVSGKQLASNVENIIDKYYNSDNNYYKGIGRRLFECSYIYGRVSTNNIPRKVVRNLPDINRELIIASRILWNDNDSWDEDVFGKSRSLIEKNIKNRKYIDILIRNCNMYIIKNDVRDAIYETAHPSPL
ncbi:hypothetical protein [Ochrobactrum sp. A-1]|uniref:hypothetical protein n=1 Tax=Ochrobactrum sp. A-1 TaxID=2920940 RepID=UPI001F0AA7E9|nr:hypothetical protein [Ochrobactrum sp. A-1]